jgi:hypothetical protein
MRFLYAVKMCGALIVSSLAFCTWCYAYKKHKFLLSKGLPIGSPFLFVRGATRVKSINFC